MLSLASVLLDILPDLCNADIAATGHLKSVQAIHGALASNLKGEWSPYWVQIGGGSLLAAPELADKARVASAGSDVIYDDLQGIEDIRSIIRQHAKRIVNNYMLSVA